MKTIIRLAILAAALSLLSGCIAWRTGPDEYEFRVPIGGGDYKCCRKEKIQVVGGAASSVKKNGGTGLPLAKVKFASGKELAEALGDEKKLNASAGEFVEAINKYHKVGLDEKSLPAYLEGLEVVDCPKKEKYVLSSVIIKGKRRLGELEREFKNGEKCFKDRNTQAVIGSADCGNIGKPTPKGFALAEYKEIEVCRKCEGPPRYSFGGTLSWGYPGGYYYDGGSSSSYSPPVVLNGGPAPAPVPSPGPAPAAPSKIGGVPAPAWKSR